MKTTIIAEIGINANGDLDAAKDLIHIAKFAGADLVKFQLWEQSTFPDLEKYRVGRHFILLTQRHAYEIDIGWFCTAFDSASVSFLSRQNMAAWKIPSNKIVVNNMQLIQRIFCFAAMENKRVYFSTGASTLKELEFYKNISLHLPANCGKPDITWMHCISKYPCPDDEVNFTRMGEIGFTFHPDNFGFSDHSLSIGLPHAAVCLGAKAIEKHLTFDRNQDGPDHKASLEPQEFADMVNLIREREK